VECDQAQIVTVEARSDPGCDHRFRWCPMRLLYPGYPDRLPGAARSQSRPQRGRYPGCPGGQSMPLYGLHAHYRCCSRRIQGLRGDK
jgi:hypothetical protein